MGRFSIIDLVTKSSKKIAALPYRDNVSGIVFKGKKFLLVQMTDWAENWWKFPQGGIDEDESGEEAVLRELKEELGTDKFKILGKSKHTNKYDWPEEFLKVINYRWPGQIQKFYLVEFTGEDKDIKVNEKEIRRYKWVTKRELKRYIDHDHQFFAGYREAIEKVLSEFKDRIK